jgi:hypothetical protein
VAVSCLLEERAIGMVARSRCRRDQISSPGWTYDVAARDGVGTEILES